jgi:restriction system protein
MPKVPTFDQLMNPTLQALRELGGSATTQEIYNKVTELLHLKGEQLELLHDSQKGSLTEIEYRLAWSRTYLKKYGLLENSSRSVWSLTPTGRQQEHVDIAAVKRFVQDELKSRKTQNQPEQPSDAIDELAWHHELLEILRAMAPAAFERLIQRLLREAGFIQVEVTGKSGDGGIDGKGIMRLGGLLSFHVIFQCKRYMGSVSASQVRDFRGAMVGRADKGLLITTGNFTKEAMREAIRDGAPAIDLIDGDKLIEILRQLGLGVQTRKVEIEQVVVDRAWFGVV